MQALARQRNGAGQPVSMPTVHVGHNLLHQLGHKRHWNQEDTVLNLKPCQRCKREKATNGNPEPNDYGNWSSFQLANSAPPLSVTDSAIAP